MGSNEKEARDVLVRGLDGELLDKVEKFLEPFQIPLVHVNRVFIERGYRALLKSKDIKTLSKED